MRATKASGFIARKRRNHIGDRSVGGSNQRFRTKRFRRNSSNMRQYLSSARFQTISGVKLLDGK